MCVIMFANLSPCKNQRHATVILNTIDACGVNPRKILFANEPWFNLSDTYRNP